MSVQHSTVTASADPVMIMHWRHILTANV